MPSLPSLPGCPSTPSRPGAPSVPSRPGCPSAPSRPFAPSLPFFTTASVVPLLSVIVIFAPSALCSTLAAGLYPSAPGAPSAPFWPGAPSAPFWPGSPFSSASAIKFSHVLPLSVLYWMYPPSVRMVMLPAPPEPVRAASLMAATRFSLALVVRSSRLPICFCTASTATAVSLTSCSHAGVPGSGMVPSSVPLLLPTR